jgi:hypothetical protein
MSQPSSPTTAIDPSVQTWIDTQLQSFLRVHCGLSSFNALVEVIDEAHKWISEQNERSKEDVARFVYGVMRRNDPAPVDAKLPERRMDLLNSPHVAAVLMRYRLDNEDADIEELRRLGYVATGCLKSEDH